MAKKRLKAAYLANLVSQVVRERDDWTCQKCHRSFRHDPGALDASHHIPRTKGIVKYDLANLVALCRACHGWLDTHPLHHIDWIKGLLGEDEYEALKARSVGLLKMTAQDTRDLAEYMRDTLRILKARRADGQLGRLDI
mgnify:FL=1